MDTDLLVSENLGLVHACARHFKGRGIDYEDLFQSGCLGLVKAAERFDETRGVRFSTYAVPVILGEIRKLFRDGGAVKVSRALHGLSIRAAKETAAFAEREGRSPSVGELAVLLGVEPAEAAEAIGAAQRPVSLTEEDDEGGGQTDIAVEPEDESIAESLSLRQAVTELPPGDRKLILLRYFRSRTQTETADELGMTQVQVSRREKKILGEMRLRLS